MILIVDMNSSKRKKRRRDGRTYRQTDRRTDGRTDGETEGGTKVVFMKVALMWFFNYRWDKFCLLAIGGTYVYLIEGGTNVGGTNVSGTNVGGRKVAASLNQ
jgi:hypothetical protein